MVYPIAVAVKKRNPLHPPDAEAMRLESGRELVTDLIQKMRPRVILEIGTFLGGSALRWLATRPDFTLGALENDELSVIKTHLSHGFGIHDNRTPHADTGSGGGRSSAISRRMRPSGECYWH